MTKPATVEDYLGSLPGDRRAVMDELRRTIRAAAPDAIETIAYDMPAMRTVGGRFVVSYAAYRGHYSLFPASAVVTERLGNELRPFLHGKGTIRFPARQPVPMDLVRRVVAIRVAETSGEPV